MDKKEYANKIHDMLSDENYCPQKKVPTLKLERLINTAFKELEKTRKRDPKLWKMITPQNSYPQLYGLLKIYKPHVPLHPIVSSTGSATSLSRQGAHMLPHTTQRQNGLLHQNSSHFVEKIGRKVPQYSKCHGEFWCKETLYNSPNTGSSTSYREETSWRRHPWWSHTDDTGNHLPSHRAMTLYELINYWQCYG